MRNCLHTGSGDVTTTARVPCLFLTPHVESARSPCTPPTRRKQFVNPARLFLCRTSHGGWGRSLRPGGREPDWPSHSFSRELEQPDSRLPPRAFTHPPGAKHRQESQTPSHPPARQSLLREHLGWLPKQHGQRKKTSDMSKLRV
uniref:Uncharacterized protein n=1 Tax=Knipowitschia caucasica TaxID=637954 RepID=A0AAV2JKK6_KNICA